MSEARRSTAIRVVSGMVVVVALLMVGQGSALASRGRCVSAEIPAPIILPDGSEHPAGQLKLCVRHHSSPVTSLHETYIGGSPVGLHASRRGYSEGPATSEPFLTFYRRSDGKLFLYGFALPGRERMEVHTLQVTGRPVSSPQPSIDVALGPAPLDQVIIPAGAQ